VYQDLTNAELNTLTERIYQAQERWYYRVQKLYPTKTIGQRSQRRAWHTALAIHRELCAAHTELCTEWLVRNYEYVGDSA
jgi:hypothetical protein